METVVIDRSGQPITCEVVIWSNSRAFLSIPSDTGILPGDEFAFSKSGRRYVAHVLAMSFDTWIMFVRLKREQSCFNE